MDRLLGEEVEQLFQLSPFHAMLLVENTTYHQPLFACNEQAKQLFHQSIEGVTVDQLFQYDEWCQIVQAYEQKEITNSFIQKIGFVQLYATAVQFQQQCYIALHIQRVLEPICKKHAAFITQYKDPIIALDDKGNIILINEAASGQLKKAVSQFHTLLDERFIGQFKTMQRATKQGKPSVMTHCKMNPSYYAVADVTIHAFPTYWQGATIGMHCIVRQHERLFADNELFQPLAYEDELTGLLNRRALHDQWAIRENKLSKLPLALLLVDIDRFKKFNESIGKEKTDELLVQISERLCAVRTKSCEIYHYSGDEFVIVMQDASHEAYTQQIDRVQRLMKQPFLVEEQEYFINVSIGISSLQRGERLDLKKLLDEANQALYFVKKHERGHARHFNREMTQEFSNEMLMEAHLKRAIEFNELSLHFQPQYNLLTEEVDSFEALLRWNNRKFGRVPPNVFIPLAETSELILEIGDWVVERACEQIARWRHKGYKAMRVAVNISAIQFKHEQFVNKIAQLLTKYHIEPHFLELEITEGALTEVEQTTKTLNALKEIGVIVSVDDFGTGYSSLSYLKSYPIDIIKIDQSFIRDIEIDEKNEKIIKAIILLSHTLGLEVIAEGVEKQSQEQFLRDLRCEKVQGYLYNKPIPAHEVELQYFQAT